MVEIKISGDTLANTIKALNSYRTELENRINFYVQKYEDSDRHEKYISSSKSQHEFVVKLLKEYEN